MKFAPIFAVALMASTSIAHAQGWKNTGEALADVDLTINTDQTIEGLGGVDLDNVVVRPHKNIPVNLPSSLENAVEFSQINKGDISATKNLTTNGVQEMEASATAIANVVSLELVGDAGLEGSQFNGGNINASLNTTQFGVQESNSTVTAIANAINATIEGDAVFDLNQTNDADSVTATLNANIYARRGTLTEVNTAATAIGNVISLELDGVAVGSAVQTNYADVTATNNDYINARWDPATATAIGNALNITQGALD